MIHAGIPAPQLSREVRALFAGMQFNNPEVAGLRQLSDKQWAALLELCDLAHLTLPLAQLPIKGLPAWVEQRLQKNIEDNTRRFELVKTTYIEAADALNHAGVNHILIKGFTQAPDYVASPCLRQQSDLDIYCAPDQVSRAQSALESIGYKADTKLNYSGSDHVPTMLRVGSWRWRGNAFDPEMPLSIELHFSLWNEKVSLLEIPEVEQFGARRIFRRIAGLSVPTLSPVDQLGHISLHILRNLLARDTIVHHVYELASFLHKHSADESFWQDWIATHSASLRAKEAIPFYLAQQWFGCDVHEVISSEIQRLPRTQAVWLQYFGRAFCENMFVENKDVVWLHLSLLTQQTARIKIVRRTFFPNRIPNANLPAVALSERNLLIQKGNSVLRVPTYLIRRTASYLKTILRTLRRGLLWRVYRSRLTS